MGMVAPSFKDSCYLLELLAAVFSQCWLFLNSFLSCAQADSYQNICDGNAAFMYNLKFQDREETSFTGNTGIIASNNVDTSHSPGLAVPLTPHSVSVWAPRFK